MDRAPSRLGTWYVLCAPLTPSHACARARPIAIAGTSELTRSATQHSSIISADADLPPLVTPSTVRRRAPSRNGTNGGVNGDAVVEYEYLNPIQRGVIVDWDQMECLWHYIFYEQVGGYRSSS